MSIDREEFEEEQVSRDEGDLDQEAWALQEAAVRPPSPARDRYMEAAARLDAEVAAHESDMPGSVQDLRSQLTGDQQERAREAFEVAAHEGKAPTLTIVNTTGQEVVCRVTVDPLDDFDPSTVQLGVDATTGLLGGPVVKPAATEEARFGERLRQVLSGDPGLPLKISSKEGRAIAARIDHDAERLREEIAKKQRVLELVRVDLLRQAKDAIEGGMLDEMGSLTFREAAGATYAYRGERFVFRVTTRDSETTTDLLRMAYNSGRASALEAFEPRAVARSRDTAASPER